MPYQLRPIHEPSEILRPGIKQRCIFRIDKPNEFVTLGRNSSTGIHDVQVSRRECTLVMNDDHSLLLDNVKNTMWVNGLPLLPGMKQLMKAGDEIGLTEGRYTYQVVDSRVARIDDIQPPGTPPRVVSQLQVRSPPYRKRSAVQAALSSSASTIVEAPATPPPQAPAVLPASVLEEFYCAICLDIQVKAMTLVPCGHTFCDTCCSSSFLECPTCRADIQSRVPCRTINNVIAAMATADPPQFLEDDVDIYRDRMQAAGGLDVDPRQPKRRRAPKGQSLDDAILID
jgi:hypothetical protein